MTWASALVAFGPQILDLIVRALGMGGVDEQRACDIACQLERGLNPARDMRLERTEAHERIHGQPPPDRPSER